MHEDKMHMYMYMKYLEAFADLAVSVAAGVVTVEAAAV